MAPVVNGCALAVVIAVEDPHMLGNDIRLSHQHDAIGVRPHTDDTDGKGGRYAVTVALEHDQAGGRYALGELYRAIERRWRRHERTTLIVEHLGNAAAALFRVHHLVPQRLAAFFQPVVEIIETRERRCVLQQAMPGIAHVLLYLALLPTGSGVTKLGLEQKMADHGAETRVDDPVLATTDLVHGGLHVVVDTTLRNALQH